MPCWDEPEFKSFFKLSLEIPADFSALSNADVESIKDNGQTRTYYFAETPQMSCYLLAICIGRYELIEARTNSGVRVRVHVEVGQANAAKFALDTAVKSLQFYEKYFDISYPLTKCDMVAIPDMKYQAMENWGLCTYNT